DVIAMTGTGAYDNPNVAGSPTKLVTASGIAATVTSSIAEGSKPVYGYTLTSTTASANIGEITPAPLTITGATTSSLYTSNLQTNTFTTSGLLGSDSVTSVATLASGTNVGTYADNLTSATGTGLTNYTIGYVNGSLTITPASLTITANDASRPVNTLNPQFSATYTGFVGGETPAMLNGVLAFATPATLTSPVGIYPITPYGQSSGNYTITYLDGDLTVYGAPVITPTLPREVVSQQAIGAQYTDPTMSTDVPTGLYYVFDDDHDSKIEKVPASMVRVVGSGIRLRN
ncbi:MAG: MBG domain-containing protein, partial [Azonexus sp.]